MVVQNRHEGARLRVALGDDLQHLRQGHQVRVDAGVLRGPLGFGSFTGWSWNFLWGKVLGWLVGHVHPNSMARLVPLMVPSVVELISSTSAADPSGLVGHEGVTCTVPATPKLKASSTAGAIRNRGFLSAVLRVDLEVLRRRIIPAHRWAPLPTHRSDLRVSVDFHGVSAHARWVPFCCESIQLMGPSSRKVHMMHAMCQRPKCNEAKWPKTCQVEPWWNPGGTLVKPLWNLTSGPPRTTPEPIWAETPKAFSCCGKIRGTAQTLDVFTSHQGATGALHAIREGRRHPRGRRRRVP